MTESSVDVFYGTSQFITSRSAGLAFPPHYQTYLVPHGEKLFTIVASNLSTRPILAHELAHLLTNTGDSAGNQTLFYPNTAVLQPLTTINGGRRMLEWVSNDARATRPESSWTAHGNRQLQAY